MHRTRRRTLLAIGPAYRGPARRDDAGGTGASTGSGSTEGGSGSTDTGSSGQGAEGTQGDGTGSTPTIDGDLDKDRAARSIAAARDGEKNAKAAAKAANERLAAVLKAAGLTPDGKTDPAEQLAAAKADADKATTRARQTAVELAVYKSAGKAGADADAVLDSRVFLAAVADLDPDAADFADKVTAAVKAAVKANPRLAAQQAAAGRVGADHAGSGGSGSIDEQIAAATKAGRHAEAIALKRRKAYTARA